MSSVLLVYVGVCVVFVFYSNVEGYELDPSLQGMKLSHRGKNPETWARLTANMRTTSWITGSGLGLGLRLEFGLRLGLG